MEGIVVARQVGGGLRVTGTGEFIACYGATPMASIIDRLKSMTWNPGVHR
jgi:hypothetical protein